MSIISSDEEKQARKTELRKLYQEWLRNRTPEEKELFDFILECEEDFFGDFTFKHDSIVSPFLEYKEEEDGKWITRHEEIHDILTSITNLYYRIRVNDLEGEIDGQIDLANRIITISPRNPDKKSTILHELIHAFEGELHWRYKEILLTCLYKDLHGKIWNLDERLLSHGHVIEGEQNMLMGGHHGLLFFLKSLDLDLRCGFNLGTVCGYGRDEH